MTALLAIDALIGTIAALVSILRQTDRQVTDDSRVLRALVILGRIMIREQRPFKSDHVCPYVEQTKSPGRSLDPGSAVLEVRAD